MTNPHNFTDTELQISVRDMGLSTRTLNALLGNNIRTLQDLLDVMDYNELGDLHLIGAVGIKEIHNKVAEMQTKKYRDFKANLAAVEQRKQDIKTQIEKYRDAIMKLENEQKYNDQMIINLQKNYNKAQGK